MNIESAPTHLDLFTGIGGFALAAQLAGFRTIGFSEIDPFCCRLLAERFPGVPNYGDIRNLPAIPCNLITGGFPCQGFSIAGRIHGTKDRANLWPPMLGVIKRCQPDWVLGENVVNIKNMVLSECLDDLEDAGYQSKAFDIPACACDLQTMERHIWIVASRCGIRLEGSSEKKPQEQSEQRAILGIGRKNGSETTHQRNGWHLPAPGLLRSYKGVPDYVDRINAIGNAINPQVAAEIMKCIQASQ